MSENSHQRRVAQRGAVTLEALLVLKVLIVAWIGLNYLGKAHIVQLQSRAVARGCAWQMAASGCQEVPPECEASSETGDMPEGGTRLEEFANETLGDSRETNDDEEENSLSDRIRSSLLGNIRDLFIERASASAGKSVSRPGFLGGGKKAVGAEYSLVCNTIPESLGDMVERTANDFKKEIF